MEVIGTEFSRDRVYRYTLTRHFTSLLDERRRYCMFIGLNPSTADERVNDPTVRRCIDYAQRWGFDALLMTNLFAYRATLPRDMKAAAEPVGADNDLWLVRAARASELIVCAWGRHGRFQNRGKHVVKLLGEFRLMHFGKNNDGTPKHPLYMPKITELIPFEL